MVECEDSEPSRQWVELMGTRVLKAHLAALIEALPAAKVALGVTHSLEAFAAVLAEAVLTADTKTRYAIVGRTPQGRPMAFGPYATHAAAVKARAKPFPVSLMEMSIWVVPLIAHPAQRGRIDNAV